MGWWEITLAFFTYVGWWLIPLVVAWFYRRALMKYPIDIVIYEKRGTDVIKTNDRAGRFEDPVHEYRLKLSKDSIPIPDYDWVLQCSHKPTNIFEKMANMMCGTIGSVTLFKYGSKQYKPVQVKLKDGTNKKVFREIKVNGQPVWMNIYEPINVKNSMGKLEFEVIDWDDINHMIQELRATASRRAPILAFMEKYGNAILFMAAVMALIIGGYYYKEMIIDAGAKASTLYCNSGTPPPADPNNNKPLDIPLIGDLNA